MGMTLNEIEEKAQELAGYLLVAGKQEALLLGIQIEGLKDLALIMSARDRRHERNAHVGMRGEENALRQRELTAMEQAAATIGRQVLGQRSEPGAVAGPPCPFTLSLGEKEYYVCTLPASHDGPHRGGGKWWEGPGNGGKAEVAEPTKPAVDQLHELLSYLINQSERELVRSQSDGKNPDEASRHLGESKAYDDAATKLQEILQEGGI